MDVSGIYLLSAMKYYSTNNATNLVDLWTAILDGIAPDGGLYMPEKLKPIPQAFFRNLSNLKLEEIAYVVGNTLLGEDLDSTEIKRIVDRSLNFDLPIVDVTDNIYSLSLYNGPTLSIKDVSARIMRCLVERLIERRGTTSHVHIIAATSGDTGGAVAKAFYGIDNLSVEILYPRGGLSRMQVRQFADLGGNVRPIEVDGTYDQCRIMAHRALADEELRKMKTIISANSINIARLLPQMIYYFWAYAKLVDRLGCDRVNDKIVFSVPCGNLGNICAGLISVKMGLPAKRFVVANNDNDSFMQFHTGQAELRRHEMRTENCGAEHIPSNTSRLFDLLQGRQEQLGALLNGISVSDEDVWATIKATERGYGILLDPHGATCYKALDESLSEGEIGVFISPTHPAKYRELILANAGIEVPQEPQEPSMSQHRPHTPHMRLAPTYSALRSYLLKH